MTKPVLWFAGSTSAIALVGSISQSQTVHLMDNLWTGKSIQAKKVPAVIYSDRVKVYCAEKIPWAFAVYLTTSKSAVRNVSKWLILFVGFESG